jgi:hypothetical protein
MIQSGERMASQFTPEAIRRLLHNPDEIDIEEYRIIHRRQCGLLLTASAGDVALREAIESCHRFKDWAEATRMVLEPIRESIGSDDVSNAIQF